LTHTDRPSISILCQPGTASSEAAFMVSCACAVSDQAPPSSRKRSSALRSRLTVKSGC